IKNTSRKKLKRNHRDKVSSFFRRKTLVPFIKSYFKLCGLLLVLLLIFNSIPAKQDLMTLGPIVFILQLISWYLFEFLVLWVVLKSINLNAPISKYYLTAVPGGTFPFI